MPRIVAVTNQKGGVGKTTTVINLAAYLARQNRRVLVVDADPQGNATSGLGADKNNLPLTLYEVLLNGVHVEQATQKVTKFSLSLLPSNANLAGAEVELVGMERREFKLKEALGGLNYDYILIDCPPSLGLLTVNALTAATDVLIPVQTEYYALEGLSQLLGVIQQVRSALNPELNLLGLVMTMFDSRTSLAPQIKDELIHHFGTKLFETVVPRNVRLAEAPSFGKTIAEHDRWSKGARAYKALARELERKIYG